MQTTNNQTIVSIQLMRAVAALSVVYVHCAANVCGLPQAGAFGVDIFFVISGFVIAYVVSHGGDNKEFLVKRFIRIEPTYLLTTVTVILATIYFPAAIKTTKISFLGFIKSLLFIPDSENMGRPILPQGWSLNYEMFFYVVMYLCVLFVKNKRYLTLACASTLVAFSIARSFCNTKSFILNYYDASLLFEFIYGIALYHVYAALLKKHKLGITVNCSVKTIILTTLALLSYGFLFYCEVGRRLWSLSRGISIGIPALVLVSAVLFLEEEIYRNHNRILQLFVECGEASYVIYLIHYHIVAFLTRTVFDRVLGTDCEIIYESVKVIIIFSLTITAGILIHRFIDMPIQRYLKKALIKKAGCK